MDKARKNRVGFIAQDVEKIIPEVVGYDDSLDLYSIDYTKFAPYLVEAIKEQQILIDKLSARIEKMEGNTSTEKSAQINQNDSEFFEVATLDQNFPNPFNQSTRINMYLPAKIINAALYVYSMQGVQIDQFEIYERGATFTTIEGHTLKAGMYLYTLIADGKEVDTKKMILTK